jgi:DNA repair photolyase
MSQRIHIEEIQCKTILNRSVMGFADFTLNAYQGCAFGCSYCYVPAMRRKRGQIDDKPWGGWLQVKVNAPDVLRRQMLRLDPEAKIAIGTATDSWQPLEKKYRIARQILEELSYYTNPVSLLTRSPLLLRDIDILHKIENVSVGVSLPTFDERVRRVFEPHAPSVAGRVHLIRKLVEAGIAPSLACAPILPGVTDNAASVRDYLKNAAEIGARYVWFGAFHHSEYLAAPHMRLLRVYRDGGGKPTSAPITRSELAHEVERWGAHYGVDARVGS